MRDILFILAVPFLSVIASPVLLAVFLLASIGIPLFYVVDKALTGSGKFAWWQPFKNSSTKNAQVIDPGVLICILFTSQHINYTFNNSDSRQNYCMFWNKRRFYFCIKMLVLIRKHWPTPPPMKFTKTILYCIASSIGIILIPILLFCALIGCIAYFFYYLADEGIQEAMNTFSNWKKKYRRKPATVETWLDFSIFYNATDPPGLGVFYLLSDFWL